MRVTLSHLYLFICRQFGLRPRYVFTRHNRLRLRFLVYIWGLVFVFSAVHFESSNAREVMTLSADNPAIARAEIAPGFDDEYADDHDVALNQAENESDFNEDTLDNDVLAHASMHDDAYINVNQAVQETMSSEDVANHGAIAPDHDQIIVAANISAPAIEMASAADAPTGFTAVPDFKDHSDDLDRYNNDDNNNDQAEGFISAAYHISGLPVPPQPHFSDNGPDDMMDHANYKVEKGDNFASILAKTGMEKSDAARLIHAVQKTYDLKYLRVGQVIRFQYAINRQGERVMHKIIMPVNGINSVAIIRDGQDKFKVANEKLDVKPQLRAQNMVVQTSLYGSAHKAGIPRDVIEKVLRIYAWDVDFQRDLRKGDRLEILYEALVDDQTGDVIAYGELKYASLSVKGKAIPVYRFDVPNERPDYYTPDGRSVRKTLMMTPIDGARISSGFGMRHHPILGYSKMHKGVDFAAPIGTPVFAAGDGVVERANRYGAYGNYVRIRHNSRLKTAYAHLKGFKSGLRAGMQIKQGDIIGYLGNTGRSTGPHLHYEVLVNNAQVSPASLDLPTGTILTGDNLRQFKKDMAKFQDRYANLLTGQTYALAN